MTPLPTVAALPSNGLMRPSAGAAGFTALWLVMPKEPPGAGARLDWVGFLSLSLGLGCLQLVLSRGQRLDWFESTEIVIETALAVVAFFMFVVHSLTAERPFLDPKLLTDPNYALGLVLREALTGERAFAEAQCRRLADLIRPQLHRQPALIGITGWVSLFMLRKGGDTQPRDNRMARALALRVGLSIALFLFVLLSWRMGWVRPTGLPMG